MTLTNPSPTAPQADAVAVLREMEWGHVWQRRCPYCSYRRDPGYETREGNRHSPTCRLAAVLAQPTPDAIARQAKAAAILALLTPDPVQGEAQQVMQPRKPDVRPQPMHPGRWLRDEDGWSYPSEESAIKGMEDELPAAPSPGEAAAGGQAEPERGVAAPLNDSRVSILEQIPRRWVSFLSCVAHCATIIAGQTELVEEWLTEDARNALENDPSVGIYANDDLSNAFTTLRDLVLTIGPEGKSLAKGIYGFLADQSSNPDAIRLNPGLREALHILDHPNAGMVPPDGGDPSQIDRVANAAADIRELIVDQWKDRAERAEAERDAIARRHDHVLVIGAENRERAERAEALLAARQPAAGVTEAIADKAWSILIGEKGPSGHIIGASVFQSSVRVALEAVWPVPTDTDRDRARVTELEAENTRLRKAIQMLELFHSALAPTGTSPATEPPK